MRIMIFSSTESLAGNNNPIMPQLSGATVEFVLHAAAHNHEVNIRW